jgi:hypothetical protein
MSGPLRRNKRSRPADAGEPLQEGLAAEPESAAPTADTPPARRAGGDAPAEPPATGAPGEPGGEDETRRAEAAAQEAKTAELSPGVSSGAKTPEPTAAGAKTPEPTAGGEAAGAKTPEPTAADETAGAKTPDASAAAESAGATTPGQGTSDEPAPATASEAVTAIEAPAPAREAPRRRWRPFRRAEKRAPAAEPSAPTPPVPVLLADPNTPAGIDPAEAPLRPPAGRRSRLRRRLRYLRRARELMLRDLGGLLYEVHRSGGGRIEAHATVVRAKVQRIAGLDAEAHALEAALAAPRSETVVFEPGVGGTCPTCGELYSSDAHYCSNCGAPVGTGAPSPDPKPADQADAPSRRAFWRRAVRPEPATAETNEQTAVIGPGETPRTPSDETSASTGEETPKAADEPSKGTGDEPAAGDTPRGTVDETRAAPTDAPAGDEPGNPTSGYRNGRSEEHAPPRSSGDPLISRESRS